MLGICELTHFDSFHAFFSASSVFSLFLFLPLSFISFINLSLEGKQKTKHNLNSWVFSQHKPIVLYYNLFLCKYYILIEREQVGMCVYMFTSVMKTNHVYGPINLLIAYIVNRKLICNNLMILRCLFFLIIFFITLLIVSS